MAELINSGHNQTAPDGQLVAEKAAKVLELVPATWSQLTELLPLRPSLLSSQ